MVQHCSMDTLRAAIPRHVSDVCSGSRTIRTRWTGTGPPDRLFTRFRDEDLHRPIIEHFERVARRHRDRIAVRDADTALTFGELWDGVSGLAETIATETKPGDLIGILLPACPMFPLAMLACLAAGRPFVALDTHYPPDWLDHVLQDARPALIIGREDVLGRRRDRCTNRARHPSDGLARSRAKGLATQPNSAWTNPLASCSRPAAPAGQRASSTVSETCCSAWLNRSTPRISTPRTDC